MSITWNSLGEITVTNQWQLLPSDTVSEETFRISFTKQGSTWDTKIRTGVYLRFRYEVSYSETVYSEPYYLPVLDVPTIHDFPIPIELKQDGIFVRGIEVRFSHSKANVYSNDSFAVFSIKIEEGNSDVSTSGNGDISADISSILTALGSLTTKVDAIQDLLGG